MRVERKPMGQGTGMKKQGEGTATRWTRTVRTRTRTARRNTRTAWEKAMVYGVYVFMLLHLVSFGSVLEGDVLHR